MPLRWRWGARRVTPTAKNWPTSGVFGIWKAEDTTVADFEQLLSEIHRIQTEITWLTPTRDFGLRPNPGASPSAIRRAERRLRRALPPSYRQFLALHDGWPRFFEGASLLGTAELGRQFHTDAARVVFTAAETPVPHFGPPQLGQARQQPLPFGADPACETFFAFNPEAVDDHGEYEVICWVNEIGLRCDDFAGFLATVREHCEAELDELTRYAVLSA